MDFDTPPLAASNLEMGVLAGIFADGTREWRDELGDVDEDTIVWRCYPDGYSVGGLILHIIEVEGWWVHEVIAGRKFALPELELASGEIDQDNFKWPVPPRKPLSWYYEAQDRVRKDTLEILCSITNPDEERKVGSGHTMSVRWIVQHVFHHEAYHGGQAVMASVLHRFRNESM